MRANFRYASLNKGRSNQKRNGIVKPEFVKTLTKTLSMNPSSVADLSTNTQTTVQCFYNRGIKGLALPSGVKFKFVGPGFNDLWIKGLHGLPMSRLSLLGLAYYVLDTQKFASGSRSNCTAPKLPKP